MYTFILIIEEVIRQIIDPNIANVIFFPQRVQYSEMAITHCQTGTDDLPDIPPELFENERSKLGKKGSKKLCNTCIFINIYIVK